MKLYDRKQPIRDGVEMAGLAERLGREFEREAFLTVATSEIPTARTCGDLRRLSQRSAAGALTRANPGRGCGSRAESRGRGSRGTGTVILHQAIAVRMAIPPATKPSP